MKRDDRKLRAAFADDWQPRDRKREKTKARDQARRDKKVTRRKFADATAT